MKNKINETKIGELIRRQLKLKGRQTSLFNKLKGLFNTDEDLGYYILDKVDKENVNARATTPAYLVRTDFTELMRTFDVEGVPFILKKSRNRGMSLSPTFAENEKLDISSSLLNKIWEELAYQVKYQMGESKENRKQPLNKIFRRLTPDELVYLLDTTIASEIDWHKRDENVTPLEKLGQTEFVYLVIEHLWEFIYDNHIEGSVTYTPQEILEIKGSLASIFGDRIRSIYHKAVKIEANEKVTKYIKKELSKNKNITESSLPKKFSELIQKQGLIVALDTIGNYDTLINITGEDVITRKVKEKFIKDVVKENQGISVFDLNEDPILYDKTETEYQEIAYFGFSHVTIQVWDLIDMEDNGEIHAPYESLNDEQIDEIFNMLVGHYLKGINII